MSPQVEEVSGRLEETWQRWWLFSLLTSGVLALCLAVGVLLAFTALDAFFHLPQGMLWALCATWLLLALGLAAGLFYRHRQGRRSLEAAARRVEMECPELGSHLINLVQLGSVDGQQDPAWTQAAVAQAAEAVSRYRFDKAAVRETRWQRFRLCLQTPRDLCEAGVILGGLCGLVFLLNTLWPQWSFSARRLFHPWAFVPSVGSVKILEVSPGNTEVLRGSSLKIEALIDNPGGRPFIEPPIIDGAIPLSYLVENHGGGYKPTVFVRPPGQPEGAVKMGADEKYQKFSETLSPVLGPFHYRLQIGDSQTELFQVSVRDKSTIEEVEITYHYPPYLGRSPEETAKKVTQKHADLEGPQFTMADLKVRLSNPVTGGCVRLGAQNFPASVADEGLTLNTFLFMQRTGTFTIVPEYALGDGRVLADPEPRVNRCLVTLDTPPKVQLQFNKTNKEGQPQASAPVGSTLPILVRAGDDNGLGLVWLELKKGEQAAVEKVKSWDKFPAAPEVTLIHEVVLDKDRFQPDQELWFRAKARDRRDLHIDTFGVKVTLGPQETETPWQKVRIIAPEARKTEDLAELEALRAALVKILAQQIKARVEGARLSREKTPEEAAKIAGGIRSQQVEIQKATVAVIAKVGKTDSEERLDIKKAANKLAYGEMLEAIRQAETLSRRGEERGARGEEEKKLTPHPSPLTPHPSSKALTDTQDRIIEVLRRMLNEARQETVKALSEMAKKPGNELKPDVQDKLRDLKDKLEKFIEQQKKVIDGTHKLAKTPVEDFTEKEEQKLKELAAQEDDWSRFMADKHSDLSKLPEQDFANPSLLQELVEVQTQLKMAEGALTKKTADIAVPLEQLGAEMAKEMTTNIEKWLPDTPDREKWSQEEPLTDDMKEAPMAELPKELEDIVGDLMEQEEDLFDEMEDLSSSWADSIDKGAGWDAMDGPISNNSARGVTGNRLPNTSEIAGRSGEGRSGKSSGEFVGDEAVGKGGRKTPTRLTPDPQMKGQVKDHSKDPTGGATGGGKESGVGGEGLQGPVPNQQQRQLDRLATKQAELRNKAESVDLQFKVMNYHHSDLRKMIEQMAAVENDLKAGRYQNALRRRQVLLEGMGQVKTYVKGEFTVREDKTSNLPAPIQKEILGSMKEPSPPGWEGLNRKYFERLGSVGEKKK